MSAHKDAFEDFTEFEIVDIKESETGLVPSRIQFEYANPAIGVDTGSSFVTHEVIGGATVRQRISDKPLEVDVSGVVRESTAKQLSQLRNAEYGTILSDRFTDSSLTVQFASISVSPMSDGGAVRIEDDEFLYNFTLNCVEILNTADRQPPSLGGDGAISGSPIKDEPVRE